MIYWCRLANQSGNSWRKVEAPGPAAAAQEFHVSTPELLGPKLEQPDGSLAYYGVVEVKGEREAQPEMFLVRTFRHGPRRRGGVKGPHTPRTIADVERLLGLRPGELEECQWEDAETMAEAQERERRRVFAS